MNDEKTSVVAWAVYWLDGGGFAYIHIGAHKPDTSSATQARPLIHPPVQPTEWHGSTLGYPDNNPTFAGDPPVQPTERLQDEIDAAWEALGGKQKHWIEHSDEDGSLRRDQLTLAGAILFALDAAAAPVQPTELDVEAMIRYWSSHINEQGDCTFTATGIRQLINKLVHPPLQPTEPSDPIAGISKRLDAALRSKR